MTLLELRVIRDPDALKLARTRAIGLSLMAAVACAGLVAARRAAAHEVADPHARHHQMAAVRDVTRTLAHYVLPDVQMVRDDGAAVQLADEIDDGRPVVLNFIYTTCTTICPLTSQTFADLQARLGAARERVHLVSISIDPEQDTPARLRAYARKFAAGAEWQHYTGTLAASLSAQRAFNALRGDKMSHTPVTYVRTAPGRSWVRFDGFATAEQLLGELHDAVAAR